MIRCRKESGLTSIWQKLGDATEPKFRMDRFPRRKRFSLGYLECCGRSARISFHESVKSHQKTKAPITTHAPRTIPQAMILTDLLMPIVSLNQQHTGNLYKNSSVRSDQLAIFTGHIGIDYSGAETPTASLKGLRIYMADRASPPVEVLPPPSPRKYWTRRGIAEWLVQMLSQDAPTLVGIDHGFSFPLRYFEAYGLKPDWTTFLDDFQKHWPTDDDNTRETR